MGYIFEGDPFFSGDSLSLSLSNTKSLLYRSLTLVCEDSTSANSYANKQSIILFLKSSLKDCFRLFSYTAFTSLHLLRLKLTIRDSLLGLEVYTCLLWYWISLVNFDSSVGRGSPSKGDKASGLKLRGLEMLLLSFRCLGRFMHCGQRWCDIHLRLRFL